MIIKTLKATLMSYGSDGKNDKLVKNDRFFFKTDRLMAVNFHNIEF